MNSAQLKKEQPVAWRMLANALKRNRLSHAYLISGQKGTPKAETAKLFAQSILCHNPDADGFACGQCSSCIQVEHEQSYNYEVLPKDKVNRKEIQALQARMAQTSVDSSKDRCYLIEDFDLARPDAANALLKFLEEPQPGIHAFLTCSSKSAILPTIVSRAQNIALRPAVQLGAHENVLEDMPRIMRLAGLSQEQSEQLLSQETRVQDVKQAGLYFLSHPGSDEAIFRMQMLFKPKTELMDRTWIRFWLQLLLEGIKLDQTRLPEEKRIKLQLLTAECIDKVNRNIDLALLLDQMYFQIRKVVVE